MNRNKISEFHCRFFSSGKHVRVGMLDEGKKVILDGQKKEKSSDYFPPIYLFIPAQFVAGQGPAQ